MNQDTDVSIKFNEQGLLPAILQDAASGEVLMLAWMNAQALELTRRTRQAHFWSRSRGRLWRKGETSGNVQVVEEVRVDCDQDTLLLRVTPAGPACHTGENSCFFRSLELDAPQPAANPGVVQPEQAAFSTGISRRIPSHREKDNVLLQDGKQGAAAQGENRLITRGAAAD